MNMLLGKIQGKYGQTREDVERQLDALVKEAPAR